ncbi:MAG: DUF695 domain-containing protein [Pyrinomonadaceae bacterium]|nr:DUF695 domain-containing protein [Phycisphaerales bacterium]
MSENWMPIRRTSKNGPSTHLIDLSYRDEKRVPDKARTLASMIEVAFDKPEDHGMGDTAESQSLDASFDDVTAAFQTSDAVLVGRVRGQGVMRFFVYSSAPTQPTIAGLARQAFAGRTIKLHHKEDPSWSLYSALLPTPLEQRGFDDLSVAEHMRSAGDPLTTPRDVRHYVYFPDERTARAFADEIQKSGFKTDVKASAKPAPGAMMCVIASRDDAIECPGITDITWMLSEQAKKLGGEYDGWEAMLIQPKRKGLLSRLLGG